MAKNWQTLVDADPLKERILYDDKILFAGSCFASEIGSRMKDMRFKVVVNPFGVLFNPASIAGSIERLDQGIPFTSDDLIKSGDIYKSFMHGSEFASISEEEFLEKNNRILKTASIHFKESRWIILTLGTSWIYREKKSGLVVSNCHKLPSDNFLRESMSPNDIENTLAEIIERFPDKRWIITVSPVRHWKDGAAGNMLSKAGLIVASHALLKRFSNTFYFPSYEIFMDELRDYRFYADDMIHPSAQSVNYIWERFIKFAIDASCEPVMSLIASLNKMRQHRPLFPESKDYRQFLKKIEELEAKIADKGL